MQKFTAWQEVIKNNTITPLQLFRRFCLLGKASWESVPFIWYITDTQKKKQKKKITAKFIFQISIHQNIIIATSLAKPSYETSIVRCVPEVAKDREIHNLFWKPSGSLIAFLFRTNKKLGTIVIHNIQQLHNYFLFIWTMVLCLDNEFNRISKLYDSMESLQALTVHHWIKPALRYFKPNFLSTTVICFRLTPANSSYLSFIFLGHFNMLGLDLLLFKDTSLQWRFLYFFVLLTLFLLLSWLLAFMLFTFLTIQTIVSFSL